MDFVTSVAVYVQGAPGTAVKLSLVRRSNLQGTNAGRRRHFVVSVTRTYSPLLFAADQIGGAAACCSHQAHAFVTRQSHAHALIGRSTVAQLVRMVACHTRWP